MAGTRDGSVKHRTGMSPSSIQNRRQLSGKFELNKGSVDSGEAKKPEHSRWSTNFVRQLEDVYIARKTKETTTNRNMLLFLYLSFAVLQVSARLVARDIEPAEETLANITNQLDNIDNAIVNFNESSVQIFVSITPGGLEFHATDAVSQQIIDLYDDVMQTTVNATTQVQVRSLVHILSHAAAELTGNHKSCIDTNGVATEPDAEEFINLADEGYIPFIGGVLTAMVNTKLRFENTSLGTAVIKPLQSTLIDYNITNGKYLAALVSGAPQVRVCSLSLDRRFSNCVPFRLSLPRRLIFKTRLLRNSQLQLTHSVRRRRT